MHSSLIITAAFVLSGLMISATSPRGIPSRARPQSTPEQSNCHIAGKVVRNGDLNEASGVAASRRVPGVLWVHNDSAQPVLLKLDENGSTVGRVRVTGAKVDDWEDIAVGPCPQQSCLYIGDIGDNNGRRKHITVYRVGEPSPEENATAAVDTFHATYPDGAHDAESLFVTSDSDIYIVTKGNPGPVGLYRFPHQLQSGTVMRLEQVGSPLHTGKVSASERPTGADASEDGAWIAVRTSRHASFYPTSDLTAGRWREVFRSDLSTLKEPQGEGIAFGRNRMVFLVGESGRGAGGGTFVRMSCTLRR